MASRPSASLPSSQRPRPSVQALSTLSGSLAAAGLDTRDLACKRCTGCIGTRSLLAQICIKRQASDNGGAEASFVFFPEYRWRLGERAFGILRCRFQLTKIDGMNELASYETRIRELAPEVPINSVSLNHDGLLNDIVIVNGELV